MAAQPVIVLCASMLPIYFFLSQTHKVREREREREREWMGEAMEESEKHICNTHTMENEANEKS